MEKFLELAIGRELAGMAVLELLQRELQLSKRRISKLKAMPTGIMVNGEHATVRAVVKEGDLLQVQVQQGNEGQEKIIPNAIPLDVLYEDEWILVVNKPPFTPVHPSFAQQEQTLANGVIAHLVKQGLDIPYRPVTRLDKDTSGIVLIAKSAYSQHQITQQPMKKEYLAIVEGKLETDGLIDAPIEREKEGSTKRWVRDDGKYALTLYEILEKHDEYTVVQVELKTGRTHQIRVHFAYMGYPLLGDELYGGNKGLINRQALHGWKLQIVHPYTGEPMEFVAPVPKDMGNLMGKSL